MKKLNVKADVADTVHPHRLGTIQTLSTIRLGGKEGLPGPRIDVCKVEWADGTVSTVPKEQLTPRYTTESAEYRGKIEAPELEAAIA